MLQESPPLLPHNEVMTNSFIFGFKDRRGNQPLSLGLKIGAAISLLSLGLKIGAAISLYLWV